MVCSAFLTGLFGIKIMSPSEKHVCPWTVTELLLYKFN